MSQKIKQKKLYIFCNSPYGHEYVKKIIDLRKNESFHIDLVFIISAKEYRSRKGDSLKSKIKKLLLFHLRPICNKTITLIKENHYKHFFVKNINSKSFIDSIPKQSIGIVCGFNQIFTDTTINKFNLLINFHPSLLPSYKGPTPSFWVAKNKEKYTGISAHKVTPNIDDGEILFNKQMIISDMDSPSDIDYRLSILGSEILEKNFEDIIKNKINKDISYDTNSIKPSYYTFDK
jgi:methionyl-tRNA formyltransferase